jgi:hypothetical protein
MSQLVTSTIIVLCLAIAACDKKESVCTKAGGTVGSQPCCKSASEFPNTCLVGACGCSWENSAPLDVCECPANKCFNGTDCVSQ